MFWYPEPNLHVGWLTREAMQLIIRSEEHPLECYVGECDEKPWFISPMGIETAMAMVWRHTNEKDDLNWIIRSQLS